MGFGRGTCFTSTHINKIGAEWVDKVPPNINGAVQNKDNWCRLDQSQGIRYFVMQTSSCKGFHGMMENWELNWFTFMLKQNFYYKFKRSKCYEWDYINGQKTYFTCGMFAKTLP